MLYASTWLGVGLGLGLELGLATPHLLLVTVIDLLLTAPICEKSARSLPLTWLELGLGLGLGLGVGLGLGLGSG